MDISVIIPIYNTEKYLSACIESVLQQENVSIELILVDDGSTDSSPSICDTYANNYSNVKSIHIQNSGPATAKNVGLKLAQGNYIALTDSDDKMEPLMLNKMVNAAYNHNADIVCCNYKQIDEQGNISLLPYTNKIYVLNHEEGLIHFFGKDKIYSQCWTKIYRREMLNEHHIENISGLHTDEDIIFNIQSFSHAQKTIIIDEPLYEYTHRLNSLARGYFIKNISQYIDNRIKRINITQDTVKKETEAVKEWSIVNNIMYYNELLGRVALFPEYYSDKRIINILEYIRHNKKILNRHYRLCGFSKIGKNLILYLPSKCYMRYRRTKYNMNRHYHS